MATQKKWSGKVKTVSTYPPEGLFTKGPEDYCTHAGIEEGITQGAQVGVENADFLYKSGGEKSERF